MALDEMHVHLDFLVPWNQHVVSSALGMVLLQIAQDIQQEETGMLIRM